MRRLWDHVLEYFPLYAGGSVILLILAACIAGFHHEEKETKRLLAQCIADGRKEYECVAMLKRQNNSTVVPVPVVIPARSR